MNGFINSAWWKNSASSKLVGVMLESEEKMKKLLDEFDFTRLENVDEYLINLGRYFSPNGQYNSLRDFKLMLDKKGYQTKLVYQQNPRDYQLVISKTKLESGLPMRFK
jgi:hypothetical protein